MRRLSWMVTIAPYRDPKELPRQETAFWPLDGDPIAKPKSKKLLAKLAQQFQMSKFKVIEN